MSRNLEINFEWEVYMNVITIVSPKGCSENQLIKRICDRTNFQLVTDDEVFSELAKRLKTTQEKIRDCIVQPGLFSQINKLKNKQKLCLFKLVIGEKTQEGSKVYFGLGSYFFPMGLGNILRLSFGADLHYRIGNYAKDERVSIEKAEKVVRQYDKMLVEFTKRYFNKSPFDTSLFDANIDVSKYKKEEVIDKIIELQKLKSSGAKAEYGQSFEDFILANKIQLWYLEKSEDVDVECGKNKIKIYLNKVKYLSSKNMENYIENIRKMLPDFIGNKEVEITIGKGFDYPQPFGVELRETRKVLLVDDEVDFVDTLSERLQARWFKTAVTYSGEEALDKIEEDQPDVMILDLKMPGIDGIEVLRRVKQTHPDTEVIILTGHGSEKEKQLAFELGAFAYLEKPVDIELLSATIRKAYDKVSRKQN